MTWVSSQYPRDACQFSYEDACSGFYDVLNFQPFHLQDNFDPTTGCGSGIHPNIHFKELEGTGDSPCISPEVTEYVPYGHPDGQLLEVEDFFDGEMLINDTNNDGDYYWEADMPSEGLPTSLDADGLKIRYTRQYLLNLRRSPLSKVFPQCLLKYLHTDEVPLKCKKPKIRYDRQNVDHIWFYNTLPYTKTKIPMGCRYRNKIF